MEMKILLFNCSSLLVLSFRKNRSLDFLFTTILQCQFKEFLSQIRLVVIFKYLGKPNAFMTICPRCKSQDIIKYGLRKNQKRITQMQKCKSCNHFFSDQPQLQSSKTYNLKTILNNISNYNLGQPLRKQKIPKSTIHNWIKNINLPMHRLRKQIKQNPIINQRFIHHKQPFLYQYHERKLQFAKKFPTLIQYLKTLPENLPNFENTKRISQISKTPTTWLVRCICPPTK
jgi:transposase-like protein